MNRTVFNKSYIPSLTSVRAIAALMVFLHHYNFIPTFDSRFIELFIFQGYAGVSLFFVLSGFLIHRNYHDLFENFKPTHLIQYFINRFARVYPLYFILSVTILLFLNIQNYLVWIMNLALLKGFSDLLKFQLISTSWSLTVEECFYLLFPIFLLGRLKKISYLTILISIYTLGYLLFAISQQILPENLFMYPTKFVTIYTFFGRGFEFLIGMLCSELIVKNRLNTKNKPYYTITGITFTIIILALLTYIASLDTTNKTPNKIVGMFSFYGLLIHHFLLPVGFALIILGLTIEKSFVTKIMSHKLFVLLGKSSYAFYLLQGFFVDIFLRRIWSTPDNFSIFAVMVMLSILLFLLLEDPLNRLIRQKNNIFTEIKSLKTIFKI